MGSELELWYRKLFAKKDVNTGAALKEGGGIGRPGTMGWYWENRIPHPRKASPVPGFNGPLAASPRLAACPGFTLFNVDFGNTLWFDQSLHQ